jgi:hypothetical protein
MAIAKQTLTFGLLRFLEDKSAAMARRTLRGVSLHSTVGGAPEMVQRLAPLLHPVTIHSSLHEHNATREGRLRAQDSGTDVYDREKESKAKDSESSKSRSLVPAIPSSPAWAPQKSQLPRVLDGGKSHHYRELYFVKVESTASIGKEDVESGMFLSLRVVFVCISSQRHPRHGL